MRKILIISLCLIVTRSQSGAQQLITFGVGFSGSFYHSADLDRFQKTYNLVYQQHLAKYMQGLDQAFGLRWEIGYRRPGRPGIAVLTGIQNYTSRDLAQFENAETRKLELQLKSLYLECEAGSTHKNFFLNGVLTLFFNRKLALKSTYSNPMDVDIPNKSLNGNYKGDTSISTDVGIMVGFYKEPIILAVKMTYPVFTAGRSSVLRDDKIEKVNDGTNIFPDNYEAFLIRKPYDGVASDINGLKVSVTIALAIPISKGNPNPGLQITNKFQ